MNEFSSDASSDGLPSTDSDSSHVGKVERKNARGLLKLKGIGVLGISSMSRAQLKKKRCCATPGSSVNVELLSESLEMCSMMDKSGLESFNEIRTALIGVSNKFTDNEQAVISEDAKEKLVDQMQPSSEKSLSGSRSQSRSSKVI